MRVLLENSKFQPSTLTLIGGGLIARATNITFINVAFIGNVASASGGGLHETQVSLTLTLTLIGGLHETQVSDQDAPPTTPDGENIFHNVTFISNAAKYDGGGLFCGEQCSFKMYDSSVIGNSALSGAGMHITGVGVSPTITRTNISENQVKGSYYQLQVNTHCAPNYGPIYPSFSSASTACALDTECYGVQDQKCDDTGDFRLCLVPPFNWFHSLISTCVYEKG